MTAVLFVSGGPAGGPLRPTEMRRDARRCGWRGRTAAADGLADRRLSAQRSDWRSGQARRRRCPRGRPRGTARAGRTRWRRSARAAARSARARTPGLFTTLQDGRIAVTELGELLRGDVPASARRGAIVSTEEWRWRAYGYLTHSVRASEPGFHLAHGCGLWEYLASEPDAAAMFNESMSRVAAANAAAIVRTYDFGQVQRFVEVGGGHGVLACAVLEANPHMRGVVFDLPGVIEGTRTHLTEAGLADRCEAIAGDFFDAVPAGGDAYVLSWILHDWDDRSAVRVLANCRAAMRAGARLLAIEMVVPSGGGPRSSPDLERLVKASDLEMLAVAGGQERTAVEYRELYRKAGFELNRIVPLDSLPWSIIEGGESDAGHNEPSAPAYRIDMPRTG